MAHLLRIQRRIAAPTVALGLACLSSSVHGDNLFSSHGHEYRPVGSFPGDQTYPQLALSAQGGFAVWQDSASDGDGLGISARRLNQNFSGEHGAFRVNEMVAGDQRNPQLAVLPNGGAVFVWQGGVNGFERVYARFMGPDGTFITGDVAVGTNAKDENTPTVTSLADGSVVIGWSALGGDADLQGVLIRRFSSNGTPLSEVIPANQVTRLNQRNVALTALGNGQVAVAWISESIRANLHNRDELGRVTNPGEGGEQYAVDVKFRIYDGSLNPVTDEIKGNSLDNLCANPSIAATSAGFSLAWSGKASLLSGRNDAQSGWDIYVRRFARSGAPLDPDQRANTYAFGDQVAPKVAALIHEEMIVWTSLAQDGSREGVAGRLRSANGEWLSGEFRVNTTVVGPQMHPSLASDGRENYIALWTGFVGGPASFDLFAQRYSSSSSLAPMPRIYVSAVSSTRLSVSWPSVDGFTGVAYEVFVDGAATPVQSKANHVILTGLAPGSTHAVRISYVLPDGRRSSASSEATGRTWGEDNNFDGLPDDWQAGVYGDDLNQWPQASADRDGDGATELQEFLAGTDPTRRESVLSVQLQSTPQGMRLVWSAEPGAIYQVQHSDNAGQWKNLGDTRFAASKTDSVPVDAASGVGLYRIIKVR